MALNLGNPFEFLGSAISPPDPTSIQSALQLLDSLDAVRLLDGDGPPAAIATTPTASNVTVQVLPQEYLGYKGGCKGV